MAIRYAGILGSIGLVTVVLRERMRGGEVEQTLEAAAVSTALLCVIGYVVGKLAGWIVLDSLRAQLAREPAAPTVGLRQVRSTSD